MSTRAERVDFYVEDQAGLPALLRAACRVVDQLWQPLPARTLVRVGDEATLSRLDDELWTFRDDAFVPHSPYTGEPDPVSPVLLTTQAPQDLSLTPEVFIDLTAMTPAADCLERFPHVAVVLDGDTARREAGRDRFREWRTLGLTPQTHPLGR
ncbi:MAG: DNA polymerase III subunit chi [Pseudomonadota bacterium]